MICRRAFFFGLLGTALGACAAPVVRTPREEVDHFPIIDVHSHYVDTSRANFGYTREDLLRAMDTAGIKRMVVLGYGPEVPRFAQEQPDRFVASYVRVNFRTRQATGDIKDGTDPSEVERIGNEFEEALRSGVYRGLGEITTRARPIPGQATGGSSIAGANISPNSPLVRRLLGLAARYDVPITIHCDDYAAGEMVEAVRSHPKSRVIWAHTGSYLSPLIIREILQEHANLSFDLSAKNPSCCPLGYSTHPFLSFQHIDESWRQLFEAYPDRFLIGVDFFASSQLRAARETGEFYRSILTQLALATARKIAYENAARAYGLR